MKNKIYNFDCLVIGSGAAGFNAINRLTEDKSKKAALITEGVMMGTSRNTGSDKQTYYKLGLSGESPDSVISMAKNLFAPGSVDGDNALVEAALSPRCFLNLCELEFSFLNTELLAALNSIKNHKPYPKDKINDNYETFLLHQFHDILPGSAIKKVYDDADIYLGKIKRDNNALIKNSLVDLLKKENTPYLLFNPNAFTHSFPVIINKECYVVKDVPSVGYTSVKLIHQNNQIKISKQSLSNEYFELKFNAYGEITYCYDKVNHKQIVKKGEAINSFIVYEDLPYAYDNWEISPYYKQKKYHITSPAKFTVINEGDRQGFKITRHYYKSDIVQYVYLYNGINRIDFVNNVKWHEKRQLLKIHFPMNIKCDTARFDVQFGSIERNTQPKNKYDEAKFEVCAHKWVDMSNHKYGVALLNDSKYGYSVDGSDLALTVLKSGSYPFKEATDICPEFKFAIFPHKGDYQNDELIKHAYALNRPAMLYHNDEVETYHAIKQSFISLLTSGVIVETFKKAFNENTYIIRGYETSNRAHDVSLKVNLPFTKAYQADLLENNLKVIPSKKGIIKFKVKPFEIFTIKIKL